MQKNKTSSRQGLRLQVPSGIWILLIPWILDLFSPVGILNSVLGASLWGAMVVLGLVYPRSQESRWKLWVGRSLWTLCLLWALYWGIVQVLFLGDALLGKAFYSPLSTRILVRIHASLLAAGLGMVCLWGLSSFLWYLQNKRIFSQSWARRSQTWKLPPLESLERLSHSSLFWAFSSWGLGLAFATITVVVNHKKESNAWLNLKAWAFDVQVLWTSGLWMILLVALQISFLENFTERSRFKSYMAMSLLFVALFLVYQYGGNLSKMHEPLRWFAR